LTSSTILVKNIFNSEKNSVRYKFAYIFMYSTHYSCQILIKLELSWQIRKKF
jgi:hypothetical protein